MIQVSEFVRSVHSHRFIGLQSNWKRFVRFHSVLGDANQILRNQAQEPVQQHVDSWEANLRGVDDKKLVGPRGKWWWTGVEPRELSSTKLHSMSQPVMNRANRNQVLAYFNNTWTLNELLFSGLQGEEAFYRPPYHELRHPMIFYYGHTASFYVNKLYVANLLSKPINTYFESIFEVGVDEMSWDDLSKNYMEWPTVSEVHEYRRQVYNAVHKVICDNFPEDGSVVEFDQNYMKHPLWALFMAFEHDRIHLETSSVLLRELPLKFLRRPEEWVDLHESAYVTRQVHSDPEPEYDFPVNTLLSSPDASDIHLGKDTKYPTFGWDNEYGSRTVAVPQFQASKFKVSNGEFYEFVKDGGYAQEKYWTSEGWGWRRFRNAKWPFFWVQAGPQGKHEYKLRTIFEEIDMPWNWPVNVNKHEADAFCNWKAEQSGQPGLRIITEAEHVLLRDPAQRPSNATPENDPTLVFNGEEMSTEAKTNLNLAIGSESPVHMFPPNEHGFHDVIGNVWEWSHDDFNPLDGFEIHPYYTDFSTPCFDGEHNMILGGSFISTGDAGANLHCRYHFRPHFLQHAGFRYVVPNAKESFPGESTASKMNKDGTVRVPTPTKSRGAMLYETDELLDQYLALHFGQQPEVVNQTVRAHTHRPEHALDFPRRCADTLTAMCKENGAQLGRALDIGCAVGGSSFHLANNFKSVTGIDFSEKFVNAANHILTSKKPIRFSVPVEGTLRRSNITVANPSNAAQSVRFMVGDACALPTADALGGKFDGILLANLLCRLPDPKLCLAQLDNLLTCNGVILTVSPFSWLEEYTNKSNWLQQENVGTGEEVLEKIMNEHGFRLLSKRDMPLLIREHERKYQYIVASAAAFVRK